jgi:hypothetical protein
MCAWISADPSFCVQSIALVYDAPECELLHASQILQTGISAGVDEALEAEIVELVTIFFFILVLLAALDVECRKCWRP